MLSNFHVQCYMHLPQKRYEKDAEVLAFLQNLNARADWARILRILACDRRRKNEKKTKEQARIENQYGKKIGDFLKNFEK